MSALFGWFGSNFDVVFFIYGLAFVVMGLAILFQPKKDSDLELSGILWLLSMFGIVHGASEWLEMWEIIKAPNLALELIKWLSLAVSYYFLFEFGRRFYEIMKSRYFLVNQRTVYWFGKWSLPVVALSILIFHHTIPDFTKLCTIWARYLLGFPGALLAGAMFFSYYLKQKEELNKTRTGKYFLIASASFVVYAFLGGLVVPEADFFPADRLNTHTFFTAVKIPVQVFRAVCAITSAWAVVGLLRIFEWERIEKIKNAYLELGKLNAALRETMDKLSHSNKDLAQFASAISHDLKEPLRTITNYVQLLEQRYKDKLDPDALR